MRKLYTYFVLVLGIAMIGLGIYLMFNPSTSLQALTIFIGIILVLNGLNEVISYFGAFLSGLCWMGFYPF